MTRQAVYNARKTNAKWYWRNGQTVEVLRPTTGRRGVTGAAKFRVRFKSGVEVNAFEDELTFMSEEGDTQQTDNHYVRRVASLLVAMAVRTVAIVLLLWSGYHAVELSRGGTPFLGYFGWVILMFICFAVLGESVRGESKWEF